MKLFSNLNLSRISFATMPSIKKKKSLGFLKHFSSCPESVLEKHVSNRKNSFSEIRISKKAYYLPTENTYEEIEIGYCSWIVNEEKSPSKFQNKFSCNQKLILKNTTKTRR